MPRRDSLKQLQLWLKGVRCSGIILRSMRLDKNVPGWFCADNLEVHHFMKQILSVEAHLAKSVEAGVDVADALSLVCDCDAKAAGDPRYCSLGVDGYEPVIREASSWKGSREAERFSPKHVHACVGSRSQEAGKKKPGLDTQTPTRRRLRGKQAEASKSNVAVQQASKKQRRGR